MAPELEAEYLREKARKELLGLLEGVSKARSSQEAEHECLRLLLGPREEEPGYQQVSDWSDWPLCPVFDAAGVRSRQSVCPGEWQH
jgi:hypothetical protein